MSEPVKSTQSCYHSDPPNHNRRGPTSFWMHDPDIIFQELNLHNGDVFLDIGSGNGDYTLRAAVEVGNLGIVYALDVQKDLIYLLNQKAGQIQQDNIKGIIHDIRKTLPLNDASVDVSFISTVLHVLDSSEYESILFPELLRVLRPHGRLVIIECKKEETPFGPPLSMRISPEELETHLAVYGFVKTGYIDLDNNYLVSFSIQNSSNTA